MSKQNFSKDYTKISFGTYSVNEIWLKKGGGHQIE